MNEQRHIKENVTYELRDKNGNLKPMFKENSLWRFLNRHFGIVAPAIPILFGAWSTHITRANLITNAGLALCAGTLNGSGSPAAATYIAVGTGTTAAAATDTTLGTETTTSGLARAAGTVSLVTTTVTNDTAQVTKQFTATGSVAVTEAGLLNAASSGTLLARQVFSAINVANGDTLTITWKIANA